MCPDQRPPKWVSLPVRRRNHINILRRWAGSPRPPSSRRLASSRHSADRTPDATCQNTVNRITLASNDGAIAGNTANQMMELGLNLGQISENIGVVVFEIIDNERVGSVVDELRALIEKSRVILVGLYNKTPTLAQSSR